jgi:hypothetical protein
VAAAQTREGDRERRLRLRRGARPRHVSLLGLGFVVVLVALGVFAAGAWLLTNRIPGALGPAPSSGLVPNFGHVYLIVFENHPYDTVIGQPDAPFINSLVARGALATDYHSVDRPSQPNYIALVSGDTYGVHDDKLHDLVAPNLADQLETKGITWAVAAENLPDPCFTGEFSSAGPDGDGTYYRKHEPFISFTQISGNPDRCGKHIHNLGAFDPAAATFQLIVPNMCHDAHDCSLNVADQWLSGFAPLILESAAFADGGVLFVTFDEGDRLTNHIAMIAVGTGVRPGTTSDAVRTHYSWLRTVQDAWGLTCLAKSCDAGNLSGLFQAGG